MLVVTTTRKDGLIGVTDTDDNIEEFYPRDFLMNLGIDILGLTRPIQLNDYFETPYFGFSLVEYEGLRGWELKANRPHTKFKCKNKYFGYPVISLIDCFGFTDALEIDISGMDTSNVVYMSKMFMGNYSLERIIGLSNMKTYKVDDMSFMFLDCTKLKSLDLSGLDLSNVTAMTSMFNGCSSLENINLSNTTTSNLSSVADMFNGCTNLFKVDLSSLDFSSVKITDSMFKACRSLEKISWGTKGFSKSLHSANDMFRGCSSLKSLDLSVFSSSKLTLITGMFTDCVSLNKLDFSNVDGSNISNSNFLCRNCKSLTFIDLGNFNPYASKFDYIDLCPSLKCVIIPDIEWLSANPDGFVVAVKNYNCDKIVKSKKELLKLVLLGHTGVVGLIES